MPTKTSNPPEPLKPGHVPTEKELAAFQRFKQRVSEAPPAPRIKVTHEKGGVALSFDHPDEALGQVLLHEAVASTDADFVNGILNQLGNAAGRGGKTSERELNFALAVIKEIRPRDQLETMLAAQMAVVHDAMMTMARRLGNAETIPQQDSAERAMNKLARTFAMQLEALKRHRSSGEQKVTVQHVNVSDGGKAIVANVTQTKPEEPALSRTARSAPTPALTHIAEAPMPILGSDEAMELIPATMTTGRRGGR